MYFGFGFWLPSEGQEMSDMNSWDPKCPDKKSKKDGVDAAKKVGEG